MSIDNDETVLDGSAPEKAHQGVLKAGDRLGDYVLMQLLGAGAMGQVYLAKQVRLNQTCAIKVLPEELSRSSDFKKRFEGEGQALARVDHRFVVRVLNASEYQGRYYMVLEYVDGGDLAGYLHKKGGKLDEAEARKVLEEVLEGLAFAHKKGIVHRDLKPANILRTTDDEFKISDFGLALVMNNEMVQDMIRKSVVAESANTVGDSTVSEVPAPKKAPVGDETLVAGATSPLADDATVVAGSAPVKGAAGEDKTVVAGSEKPSINETARPGSDMASASAFVGTLDYMSPEVRAGQSADARSDIYAIGIIAYQMLTGRKPLGRAKAVSVLAPGIAPEWDAWVDRCLEIEPADRFASATEALEALGRIPRKTAAAPTGAIGAVPPPPPVMPPPPPVVTGKPLVQEPFPVRKTATPPPVPAKPGKPGSSKAVIVILVVLVLLIAAAAAAFFYLQRRPNPSVAGKPQTTESHGNALPTTPPPYDAGPSAPPPVSRPQTTDAGSNGAQRDHVAAKGKFALKGHYNGLLVSLDGSTPSPAVEVYNDIDTGKHIFLFARDGYEPQEVTARSRVGDITQVRVPDLKRQTGTLAITGKPVALDWKVVGKPADATLQPDNGKTPFTLNNVPTGKYVVEFSVGDFRPQSVTVTVAKGLTADASVFFAGGSVSIKSNVPGAVVRDSSGEELGRTPLAWPIVPAGDYSFSVSADGYGNSVVRGHLDAGGSLELFANLEKFSRPEPGRAAGLVFPTGVLLPLEWIRPGDFRMGSDPDEVGRERSEAAHNVRIANGFWLSRYEVTQAQWKAVMGSNPSGFSGVGPDAPVERVSWDEAVDFCRKLTAMAKESNMLPDGYVYALPTEAEWEYACRAGSIGAYSGEVSGMGWTAANSGRTTHIVGQKAPNAFGLCDIYGNVSEWCADWFGEYNAADSVDPRGPATGRFKVARGGSWQLAPGKCRSAARNSFVPTDRWNSVGFRVALVKAR